MPRLGVSAVALLAGATLVLSGCGTEEPTDDQPTPTAEPTAQTTLRVGVQLDAPGLAAGVDPSSISGLDADLVSALATELPDTAVEWFPVTAEQVRHRLAREEIDLALVHGPVAGTDSSSSVTVVGPYLSTVPALLVPAEDADALPGDGSWEPVAELADLDGATVCVPDGADRGLLELDDAGDAAVLEQPSAAECALALTSGRVQAVLSDRVQLTGLAGDARFADQVQLVEWEELSDATPPAIEYQALVRSDATVCQPLFELLADPDRMTALIAATDAVEASESAASQLAGRTSPC